MSEPFLAVAAGDAADPLAAVRSAIEAGKPALLFEAGALPARFFDLRSGVLGEVVQKLTVYGMRMAAVVPDPAAHGPRFAEFAREAHRGATFRFCADRAEAVEWLSASRGAR